MNFVLGEQTKWEETIEILQKSVLLNYKQPPSAWLSLQVRFLKDMNIDIGEWTKKKRKYFRYILEI